jgi:hypothetical protein
MNVRRSIGSLVVVALLCTAAPALAEATPQNLRASALTGATVLDPQSQVLGRIVDVLLDARSGESFVIIDSRVGRQRGPLLVAPYRVLRFARSAADNRPLVVLDLRPQQMPLAPQVASETASQLQDAGFLAQARDFYQVKTYSAARPIQTLAPATAAVPAAAPTPAIVPAPCNQTQAQNPDSDWPEDLREFSSE